MAIELPRVLKNMNLFVDGRGYAGRIDEIQLPKLTLKTEEHRAGGMDLPVEIDLGMEKLEAELTIADHDPGVFKLFGLLDNAATQITIRGAIQAQGAQAKPVIVNLRGGWKELDAGTRKPGSSLVFSPSSESAAPSSRRSISILVVWASVSVTCTGRSRRDEGMYLSCRRAARK